jgi:hypothetical protein
MSDLISILALIVSAGAIVTSLIASDWIHTWFSHRNSLRKMRRVRYPEFNQIISWTGEVTGIPFINQQIFWTSINNAFDEFRTSHETGIKAGDTVAYSNFCKKPGYGLAGIQRYGLH